MNQIWRSISAVIVVALFVFIVGYIEFREDMLELGLVLTWDLVPQSVATPGIAYLERIALFVLFGIVALLFLTQRRGLSDRTGVPALVGGLTLVAISGWAMITVDHQDSMPIELNESADDIGWMAALETGALSSAVLGMAALLLVIALLRMVSKRNRAATAP